MNATTCRKCGNSMKPGIAMGQTYTMGIPDFPGQTDMDGQTISPGGSGKIVDCLKCEACGHSYQPPTLPAGLPPLPPVPDGCHWQRIPEEKCGFGHRPYKCFYFHPHTKEWTDNFDRFRGERLGTFTYGGKVIYIEAVRDESPAPATETPETDECTGPCICHAVGLGEQEDACPREKMEAMERRALAAEAKLAEARTALERSSTLAAELVAIIRVNSMRGTWAHVTPQAVDEFLSPWVAKLSEIQALSAP